MQIRRLFHSRTWSSPLLLTLLIAPRLAFPQGPPAVTLPKPRMEGGKPLMQALKERQSGRQFSSEKPEDKPLWAAAGSGFIGQNVYLFCASEGLVTVFRAFVDREAVSKALGLRPDQKVLFSQTVGYPQK